MATLQCVHASDGHERGRLCRSSFNAGKVPAAKAVGPRGKVQSALVLFAVSAASMLESSVLASELSAASGTHSSRTMIITINYYYRRTTDFSKTYSVLIDRFPDFWSGVF